MLGEVCDSEKFQELEEVGLLVELVLGSFVAPVSSFSAHVTEAILATAGAEDFEEPSANVLCITVSIAFLTDETLRYVLSCLFMGRRFLATLHTRSGCRGVDFTDQATAKLE